MILHPATSITLFAVLILPYSMALARLVALSALARPVLSAGALPTACLLYIDGVTNRFNFGVLATNGTLASLITLPTWGAATNGIDAGLDNTTFYAQPDVVSRRGRGRVAIKDVIAERAAAESTPIATIALDASRSGATASYATLGPIPGHTQVTALADASADTNRNVMVGTVEAASGALLFVIADVDPSKGSVGPVWRDITTDWSSWTWMKYGVSTYDAAGQVYYLTVGVKSGSTSVETVMGFPLQSTAAPIPLPLPGTQYDILSLDWSSALGAPVISATDRVKKTVTILVYEASMAAWAVVLSYPSGSVDVDELGQATMSGDGATLVLTLRGAGKGWDYAVSFVSLTARKEVKRVTVGDDLDLLADIVLCDALAAE